MFATCVVHIAALDIQPTGHSSSLSSITLTLPVTSLPLLRVDQMRAPLLAVKRAADMNTTADQIITLGPLRYVVRRVIVCGASGSLTSAAGGIYTGSGKTGTAIVPAAQSYAALTSGTKFIDTSLHASVGTDRLILSSLYLSLSTPQGAPMTADIYIYGEAVEN